MPSNGTATVGELEQPEACFVSFFIEGSAVIFQPKRSERQTDKISSPVESEPTPPVNHSERLHNYWLPATLLIGLTATSLFLNRVYPHILADLWIAKTAKSAKTPETDKLKSQHTGEISQAECQKKIDKEKEQLLQNEQKKVIIHANAKDVATAATSDITMSNTTKSAATQEKTQCGDPPASKKRWWSVNGPPDIVTLIKNEHCSDAFITKGKLQIASFHSRSAATEFARSLESNIGVKLWVK